VCMSTKRVRPCDWISSHRCPARMRSGRRRVVSHDPTFEMIGVSCANAGAELASVGWLAGSFPTERLCEAIDGETALAVLVTPNNPTGGAIDIESIERIADRAADVGARLLVDLAYVEFASTDPTQRLLERPNVILVRTLSKAWGLAGLRIGYLLASEETAATLRDAGGPFPVSGVSIELALRALTDGWGPARKATRRAARHRDRIGRVVEECGGSCGESEANFVLARFDDAPLVRAALAALGIGVRSFPDHPDLADALRITCPTSGDDMDRLERALRTIAMPQALLFDLDGVIADVSRSYRRAIIETVATFGVEATPEQIGRIKREGGANNDWELTDALLRRLGKPQIFEDVKDRFEALYHGTDDRPGLKREETLLISRETLSTLCARMSLGIVTGRPRADALEFLERFDIADQFGAIVTMEDAPAKPDPAPVRVALESLVVERAWLIGDTVDDVRASRAAGVLPIGVVPPGDDGGETARALLGAGAARVLDRTERIGELLR